MTISDDEMSADCATCGLPLGRDPDDDAFGDSGLPICGARNRARNFDAIEEIVLWEETDD